MGSGVWVARLRAAVTTIAVACVGVVVLPTAAAQAAPTFSVNSPSALEGAGEVVFTVTLSEPVGNPVSVDVHTSSVTATSSLDYVAVPRTTLTFAPGDPLTKTVPVQIIDDLTDENDESFTLQLTGATGGASIPPPAFGTATILDDDPPPTVSIEDASVAEQTNATSLMGFRVRLSRASAKPITVKWTTSDGTATAPADYTHTTNTATFSPGTVSQFVNVQIVGDTLDETDETFFVTLSDPVNVTIDDGLAIGTIRDDDGPNITITGATVIEGGPGTTTAARLTVALSALSPQDVSAAVATTAGTATSGEDYDPIPANTRVTVPAGQLVAFVEVPVHGDAIHELDETFTVNLTAPQGGNLTAATAVVTITDDDPMPGIVVLDSVVPEGTGGATTATVTVGLTHPAGRAMTVSYTTRDGSAVAGLDYAGQTGTVRFEPGETAKTVGIPVAPDSLVEDNETFLFVVTGESAPEGGVVGTVTIIDDDLTPGATPTLSISGGSPVREGDTGTRVAEFTVRMDRPITRHVAVNYATASGSATSGVDFEPAAGTLTFAPGESTKTILVVVNGDREAEPNEDFAVVLSNPVNARIAAARGLGIIVDDDTGLTTLSVAGAAVRSESLLCPRGTSAKRCRGLLLRWASVTRGSLRVDVDVFLPAAKKKASAKKSAAGKKAPAPAKMRRLRLLRKTYTVGRGARSVRVRGFDRDATTVLRRIRAAKVRTARVTVTFTNRDGAQEVHRFTVRLR